MNSRIYTRLKHYPMNKAGLIHRGRKAKIKELRLIRSIANLIDRIKQIRGYRKRHSSSRSPMFLSFTNQPCGLKEELKFRRDSLHRFHHVFPTVKGRNSEISFTRRTKT